MREPSAFPDTRYTVLLLIACVWLCEACTQSASERVTENHHNELSLFHNPKIWNKVRPVSVNYGTGLLVAKYGTIPYFTGRLATLGIYVG